MGTTNYQNLDETSGTSYSSKIHSYQHNMVSRKYLPRDCPKICTVCQTTNTPIWRVKKTEEGNKRVCNKCAAKSFYKPTSRITKTSILQKAICKLLKNNGNMKAKDIIKNLQDIDIANDSVNFANFVSNLLCNQSVFMRISRGVYAIKDI